MVGDTVVEVRYTDGTTEDIECYSAWAKEGVLHMRMRMHSHKPDRHIPLERIAEYTTREVLRSAGCCTGRGR